jgi:2-polyprenyl-6-methoxyphenol hydroxylase-like FAD-dependent oxidoreductase
MASAHNMDTAIPMLLPGIRIQTSPTDAFPIEQLAIERFEKDRWVLLGDPIDTRQH